jgi:hypothetical protein
MLSLEEIVGKEIAPDDLSAEKLAQEQDLLERVNKVRSKWGKPMTVTSGVRTWEHHTQIYKDKAAKSQKPFEDGVYDESKVPKLSPHLENVTDRAAVDTYDPNLELTAWLKADPSILEDAGLYCEEGNTNWVHFQNHPPKSGKRWFLP